MAHDADVIIVGAGLAGLVAAAELVDAGKTRHRSSTRSPSRSLGGQAFWSLGGLFFVDSPEQRRLRHPRFVRPRARRTGWARRPSIAPRIIGRARWAEAYVAFAAGEKRAWLHERGLRFFPVVGWAERGGVRRDRPRQFGAAISHHVGHRARRARAVRARVREGRNRRPLTLQVPPPRRWLDRDQRHGRWRPRRRARTDSASSAAARARARSSANSSSARRPSSSRPAASAAITSWCASTGRQRLGTPPQRMVQGVPDHVDGRMLAITEAAGGTRDQSRPHVALRRRPQELEPDLDQPRHPHPARPVVAVARRARATACRRRSIPASTRSARSSTS